MEAVKERTPPPISDSSLWFGVGTGVAVWMLHLMAMYALVALACGRGWLDFTALGLSGMRFTLLILTLLAVALVGSAALTSYRHWRGLRQQATSEQATTTRHKRYVFMTFSGILLNIGFTMLIVMTLVPTFAIPPCQ